MRGRPAIIRCSSSRASLQTSREPAVRGATDGSRRARGRAMHSSRRMRRPMRIARPPSARRASPACTVSWLPPMRMPETSAALRGRLSPRACLSPARCQHPRGARRRAVRHARLRRRARGHHGLARIDPRSVNSQSPRGQHRFRGGTLGGCRRPLPLCGRERPDRVQAGYGQLMYWLAQMRAVACRSPNSSRARPAEGWPQPLLLYMRGEYTEAELIAPIEAGDDSDNDLHRTPAPTNGCARRCTTSAKRTGRADNPRWRATISPRW